MNGYRVCGALRAAGDETPVLMLTAKDGEYDEAEGLDTGADDYLTKPFSYVVLLARVRALLRRRTRGAKTVLRLGTLSVDPGTRQVAVGEREVEVTAKEFAVLEHLAVRAGDVVSKGEILEHVWDFAYEGDVNIVEVYVSALRRKLGAGWIATVRGAGYRLVDAGA
jgi:DNA-binding response OmpR family regulator